METLTPIFDIIRRLRGHDGCDWDRRQTAESMLRCLVEEVYELQDAIVAQDLENICEEIGDVLFQLAFIVQVYQESEQLSFAGVVDEISAKMIRRHPHVYGNATVRDDRQLKETWEQIKKAEKHGKTEKHGRSYKARASVLDGIPSGMPALSRAWQVSKAAVKAGFDWDDIQGVINTLKEEIQEFEAAFDSGTSREALVEMGDVFFTLVNVARFAGIYPETALAASTAKFENRFRRLESMARQQGAELDSLGREELDRLWEEVKTDYAK